MRVYRASAFGGCMKAQIAAQLDYTPIDQEKKMERMSREGELHELAVLSRLSEDGYEIWDRQREVELQMLPGVIIRGHLDASTYDKTDSYVIEVKSMSPDEYKKWIKDRWDTPGHVQKYKWQVSIYMLAMCYKLMFIVKNRSTGEIDISYLEEPPYDNEAVLGRILEMERYVRLDKLPDECDIKNFPCPFYYLEQQLVLEYEEDQELENAAIAYEMARQEVKEADERLKESRQQLDTVLAGREKVATDKVKVTYYERKFDKVDVEKMKGDGIDVEKYTRPVVSRALRVTVREDKSGRSRDGDEANGDSGGDGKERGSSEAPAGEG